MKTLRILLLSLVAGVSAMGAKAQIGYQVSLLNTATGEPRANETVTVSVTLSNSEGGVFYSETKSATTNDFGVLSLSIGNADTFKDVDLTKMPFYIEASANGVMIGKSQMLSVPVAEVAKQVAPVKLKDIVGTWRRADGNGSLTFSSNYSFSYRGESGNFFIQGNIICGYTFKETGALDDSYFFILHNGRLFEASGEVWLK